MERENNDNQTLTGCFLCRESGKTNYDCSRCRNCCKQYCGRLSEEDLSKDAAFFHLSVEEFRKNYLLAPKKAETEEYRPRHIPCDFLGSQGDCLLEDCKPKNCVDYPYKNKPAIWQRQSAYEISGGRIYSNFV